MDAYYIDLHIHTSDNSDHLDEDYPVSQLLERVKECAKGDKFILSLTDHNTINVPAYLSLIDMHKHVLVGVEVHVSYSPESRPYHGHLYFNLEEIDQVTLDSINSILDKLYPTKEVTPETTDVPTIERIIRDFDAFDFLFLPHGGQSHSTFDESIPDGARFDTTLERSIYYNQFDGFTARSNAGLERTLQYFNRLGIDGIVNLITCSDNYKPEIYPDPRSGDESAFVPTYILSRPSFQGLRLALSESTRIFYGNPPDYYSDHIRHVNLTNDTVDIDADLTQGLNVIIGSSSSGKTLFVDSLFRACHGDFEDTDYEAFGVESINVLNPTGITPHYIGQNYIVELLSDKTDREIGDIPLIKDVFPEDQERKDEVRRKLDTTSRNNKKK